MVSTIALVAFGLTAARNVGPTADPTQEALLALDTDGSGSVQRNEIEAFARAQGLSPAEVQSEFRDLDTNGDGELSAKEISSTLSQPEDAGAAADPAVDPTVANAAAPTDAISTQSAAETVTAQPETVEFEARQDAAKVVAETFAHSAADVLAARGQDVEKAATLEEAAKSLRGKTAELRRTAAEVTFIASRVATEAVLHEGMDEVKALEVAAAKATQDASDRRARAKASMQLALKAQGEMRASVAQLGTEPA